MEKSYIAAGVEHRGLHALQHSFASNLYTRGVEVKIISKLLGHGSVEIAFALLRGLLTTPPAGGRDGISEKADGFTKS